MANRRNQGGGWTDWTLDPASKQYYRARQNWSGHWEYQYEQPAYPTNTHHQSAPRGAPEGDGVEDLASSFNAVNLQDTSYGHDQSDAQDDANYSYTSHAPDAITTAAPSGPSQQSSYPDQSSGYTASSYQDYASAPFKGKGPAFDQPKPRPKGKGPTGRKPKGKQGRGYSEGYIDEPAVDLGPEQPPFYEAAPDLPDAESGPAGYGDTVETYTTSGEATIYASEYPQNAPGDHVDDQVANTATLQEESQEQYYPGSEVDPVHQHGESELDLGGAQAEEESLHYSGSSNAAYTGEEGLDDYLKEADGYGTGVAGASSSVAEEQAYEEGHDAYSYQHDTGQQTPRARSPEMAGFQYGGNTMNQTINEGHYGTSRSHGDDLFSRYTVEPSSRFQPGSVFKIYWSEPLGDGLNATVRSYMDKKGEKFHYSFRRFIVVASDEGHSTCVPILTYGHRACTKRGVKAQKHGIVYQAGNRPFRLHGEPELGFHPARVELFERTEKLDKESRVNYSKLVTVEHNYRVFFIGRIHPRDFQDIVGPAVDTCWGKKRRHHR